MTMFKLSALSFVALVMGFVSCKKEDQKEEVTPAVTKTDSVRASTTGNFAFYSFKDGKAIEVSDSATTKWDFGIRFVSIIVNSHASGPGNVGVVTEKGIFDTYTVAPESGYAYDTTSSKLAINSEVTGGWYNYSGPPTHSFSPKAGMFFVFKTTDNNYVKVEMLSARYEDFVGPMPTHIWHKFRYVYQPDGSREFK
ncbi:MAG: HmuY family protein [Bacteroidetes bacterium]|nr:HmuY family protein [Bacteroidota bacterium]